MIENKKQILLRLRQEDFLRIKKESDILDIPLSCFIKIKLNSMSANLQKSTDTDPETNQDEEPS